MIALRLVIDTNIIVSAALKPRPLHVTLDPDDNKFLECADAARADYLVARNRRHFPTYWKKTKVITSREFISIVAPHLMS